MRPTTWLTPLRGLPTDRLAIFIQHVQRRLGDRSRVAIGVVTIGRVAEPPPGADGNRVSATIELPSVPFQQRIDFQRSAGPILTSGDDGGRLGNYADRVVATGYRTSKVVGSMSSTGPTRPWARSTI